MTAFPPPNVETVESQIFELLSARFGEPETGAQELALSAAVAKLIGLSRELRAQRSLKRWHNDGHAFSRAVERSLARLK